jgi:hypothetical protein
MAKFRQLSACVGSEAIAARQAASASGTCSRAVEK